MNKQEIFSKRLKNARIMQSLSMDALCKKMNNSVSKMAISKYENGKAFPSSTVLIKLAEALNVSLDYFFKPFSFSLDSISFRKKSSLGVKKIESIKEIIADYAERYIEIETICAIESNYENLSPKVINSKKDVYEAAKELRKEWNLGEDGIVNIIELLEEHDFKVLEIEAPEKFDGLSTVINGSHPIIVLNKELNPERKRFTALHELAHIILSFPLVFDEKEQEMLCNLFANEVLIPISVFKKIIGSNRHDVSYVELQSIQLQFGISCDALMHKAKDAGIISEQRYKVYWIKKNRDPFFKEKLESSLYPEEKSMRFERLVHKALSKELISLSKAASLLKKDLEQIRKEAILI